MKKEELSGEIRQEVKDSEERMQRHMDSKLDEIAMLTRQEALHQDTRIAAIVRHVVKEENIQKMFSSKVRRSTDELDEEVNKHRVRSKEERD